MSKRAAARAAAAEQPEEQPAKKAAGASCWTAAGEQEAKTGLHPLLVRQEKSHGSKRVVGFDLDDTIITPKSGKTFATSAADWTWWHESVPAKLKQLHESGAHVVIFTNQAGIEKGHPTASQIQTKIDRIIEALGIPVTALVVTGHNHFRKPSYLLWEYFVENCNNGVVVDLANSLYVGDAGGRTKGWAAGKKKDFACTDRMFAANAGIGYHTPDFFFLNVAEAAFEWGGVNPKTILALPKSIDEEAVLRRQGQEMVVMVGRPASGKSSISDKFFHQKCGYVLVNRDTLSTDAKCKKAAKEALSKGQSVVIDNTSPSVAKRAEWIALAREHKVPVRCVYMTTPRDVSNHLNFFRVVITNGKVRRIPAVAYNMYNKSFEEPTKAEGFTDVIKVDFHPVFSDERAKFLFGHWQEVDY